MRSKPLERIVSEAKELLNDGAFELLLIGQDTTSYGDDIGMGLRSPSAACGGGCRVFEAGVVRWKSAASPPSSSPSPSPSTPRPRTAGCAHVRLPSNFSKPIIEAFANLVKRGHLLPYLDIPLQHASTRVLTAMRVT